jgi:hypothetical protein
VGRRRRLGSRRSATVVAWRDLAVDETAGDHEEVAGAGPDGLPTTPAESIATEPEIT